MLFLFMPPNAIKGFLVYLLKLLNLNIPKDFLDFFVLNKGDKKICSTFCFSLILISFKEWAEPTIICLLFLYRFIFSLLNAGI